MATARGEGLRVPHGPCMYLADTGPWRGREPGCRASPAARVGFVHFKLICLSSILMVAALTAVDFISLKPIL